MNSPRNVQILTEMADSATERGFLTEAEHLLSRAINCTEANVAMISEKVVVMLQLAFLYEKQQEYGKATAVYLEALALLDAHGGNNDLIAGILLHNLADSYNAEGKISEAAIARSHARQIFAMLNGLSGGKG